MLSACLLRFGGRFSGTASGRILHVFGGDVTILVYLSDAVLLCNSGRIVVGFNGIEGIVYRLGFSNARIYTGGLLAGNLP